MNAELSSNENLKLDAASLERLNSSKDIPEQLKNIYTLLNSYGVEECEPNVPMMLLELITSIFAYYLIVSLLPKLKKAHETLENNKLYI